MQLRRECARSENLDEGNVPHGVLCFQCLELYPSSFGKQFRQVAALIIYLTKPLPSKAWAAK